MPTINSFVLLMLLATACGGYTPPLVDVTEVREPKINPPVQGSGIIDRVSIKMPATPCLPVPENIPVIPESTRPIWAKEMAKLISAGRKAPQHNLTSQSGAASWQPLTEDEIRDPSELKRVIVARLGGTMIDGHVLDSCQPLAATIYTYMVEGKPNLGIPLTDEQLLDDGFYTAREAATGEKILMKMIMPTDVSPNPRVTEAQVLKVCFDDVIGQRACAFVLVPNTPGPHPLAVAFHQSQNQWGALETMGAIPYNHMSMTYGQELAGRGYVVVMPIQNGYGELFEANQGATEWNTLRLARIRLAFPNASLVLTEFWQSRRAVDAVLSFKNVLNIASDNYAVMGHSKGGYNAVVMGALDPRVKSTFANGGRLSYPMKGLDGDDNATELTGTAQRGMVYSWCEWSGYITDTCFYEDTPDEYPLDANVFFPLLVGPGKSFIVGLIEDDRLPGEVVMDENNQVTRSRWLSMRRLGEELKRVAILRGGIGYTGIVWSGFREAWGIPYLAANEGDLVALRKFTVNQNVGGRTHGLYRTVGIPAAAIMDALMFGDLALNPNAYASEVHLSNGGRY